MYEEISTIGVIVLDQVMTGKILNTRQKTNLSNNCLIWNIENETCLQYGIQ